LIVCVGSTFGWRHTSPLELAGSMTRAGARVEAIVTGPLRPVRTFMLTDLAEARAARRTAQRGIASFHPRAIVYCSMTASLLWPRPGAIWFDSVAAENRPGRHGLWQRVVERRRIREAPLLIGMSADALSPLRIRSLDAVVPVPVEPSAPARAARDITAVTYAGDPAKRRLSLVLDAWEAARRPGEELMVAGTDSLPGGRDGVSVAGRMAREDYRALLRRAQVFVTAPLREDYGTAALEALADGCRLVTTEAAGPYPALSLARTLDPRLVGDDLARALRVALDDPVPDYASRAEALLAPFRRGAIDDVVKRDVLPSLLPGFVPS
jgi:glycosyltransferase involved in cell wall biosynthesis